MEATLVQNTCEQCGERSMFGVYNDRKLCIECHGGVHEETVDFTGQRSMVKTPEILPPIKDARTLVDTLSRVMDDLLSGKCNVEKARTACQISSETVKILDLMWRIENGRRK